MLQVPIAGSVWQPELPVCFAWMVERCGYHWLFVPDSFWLLFEIVQFRCFVQVADCCLLLYR